MNEVDVLGLQGWRMGPYVECVDFAVWTHHLKNKLAFRLGHGFQACPRKKACSCEVILLERPETTAEDSRLLAVCTIADHGSRAGTTSNETCFPKFSATETARVKSCCS